MVFDIQKAGIWKRIAAWMFDGILVSVLAVAVALGLSALLGYDSYSRTLDEAYATYEAEYGISFEITQAEYEALTEQQRQAYDTAYQALLADDGVIHAYNMMISLTLVIISLSILAATLIWEFAMPLLFGNGQTLGKKIFGLCLIRSDGVKVNNLQLFTRALIGKYTIETMIPVSVALLTFWGTLGLTGTVILFAVAVAQMLCLGLTRTNSAIHDLLAGTVVVDMASQMIFRSTEDLIAYQKKIAAERAARQTY